MAMQHVIGLLVTLVASHLLLVDLVPVAMARPEPVPHQLVCNMLPTEECAFAVDSAGKRCVLETLPGGTDWHVCQTSDIMVSEGIPVEYIETEQCTKACGVAKLTVGLSTDPLRSKDFTSKLCSSDCQENCKNLVDLYYSLAAGDGRSLKMVCATHQRRRMAEKLYSTTATTAAVDPAVDHASLQAAAEAPIPTPVSGA